MEKIIIKGLDSKVLHESYFNMDGFNQEWLDYTSSLNIWGLPERWLPDYLEGVETREVEIGEGETRTEYLYPATYTVEILDITAQHNAEQALQSAIAAGERAETACKKVKQYVTGYSMQRAMTSEQVSSFIATFGTIQLVLDANRPNTARVLIEAVSVDGDTVTEELKDNALAILTNYGF
jgi:hypothetical protein